MSDDRVFVEWECGAYVSSLSPDFQAELVSMVEQYGPPSKVEFRAHGEGWAPPSPPCEECGKGVVDCHCDEVQCPACSEWFSADADSEGRCPCCSPDNRTIAELGTWSAIDSWPSMESTRQP